MKSLIVFALFLAGAWCSTIQKRELYNLWKSTGPRIIGGNPAEDGEFPYVAAIWKTTEIGKYFCSGAVIDRKWILTAASCVQNATSFSIQLGAVSLSSTDINRVNATATKFEISPDFNPNTLENNIGLINLDDELKFNDYVNTIALPSAALEDNTDLISTGWGQTDDFHSGPVDVLRKVEVVSLPNQHCKNIYGTQITDSMVCAMGLYNEGTCIGDMGGPLVEIVNDTATVVAVASFLSFNGCESLDPSGFERTFGYLDWINGVISG